MNKLRKLLAERKIAILDRWQKLLLDTYSPDAAAFFGREKDRFANPVGQTFLGGTRDLLDHLVDEMDPEQICTGLHEIIKIRSIQDFSPSQAVGFVLLLKQAIRDVLEEQKNDLDVLRQLIEFEARVDQVVLFAFDIYVSCRERVYQLRVNEVKRRVSRVLDRTKPTVSDKEPDPRRDCLESQ